MKPWRVSKATDTGNYLVMESVGGQVICEVEPGPEARKNAYQIAAVPELLEALQALGAMHTDPILNTAKTFKIINSNLKPSFSGIRTTAAGNVTGDATAYSDFGECQEARAAIAKATKEPKP